MGGDLDGGDHVMDDPAAGGAALANGSKSLVTGRKGFSAHFTNIAHSELVTHIEHPVLLTKAITLSEGYEAACISRLLAIHKARLFNELVEIVWMTQSLRTKIKGELTMRFDFLLAKARQNPNAGQWKN